MFHSSFAHLQFSHQLLHWHSNLFPPAILCVAAPKKQAVAFPEGKFDIVKPGVVRVNNMPQIQPMFRGLELEEIQWKNCVFDSCLFPFTRFRGGVLEQCGLLNCVFENSVFFNTTLICCKCTGSNFSGAKRTALTFQGGDYSYCSLEQSVFRKADLSGVIFRCADLRQSDLRQADLTGADLTSALLQQTDLTGADLREAKVEGVDFRQIKMKNTRIGLEQAVEIARSMGCVLE